MQHFRLVFLIVSSFLGGCAEGTTATIGSGGADGSSTSSSGSENTSSSASSSSTSAASSSSSNSSSGSGGAGGAGGGGGSASSSGGSGGGPVGARSCPPGEFITNIGTEGALLCSSIDALTKSAFDDHCRIHLGWRDQCGACTTPPLKWGSVSAKFCNTGIGVNNTCETVDLGGTPIELFGLNTDGDVDTNDKLYARFSCDATMLAASAGPCDAGELAISNDTGMLGCGAASAGILDALRSHCRITVGARDNCDNCTTPPLTWGQASTLQCNEGGGADTTCVTATLGTETMNMIGLDFEGDIDGNDKLYVGLDCSNPTTAPALNVPTCPAGQYATGITADGKIDCSPVDALAIAYFESHCRVYMGWSDSCSGCMGLPQKWGYTSASTCQNGVGVDSNCIQATLGTEMVRLFGLNFDGDVNDDDTIYMGLHCE